jgi:putative NADPH-quinone reductase
MGKRVLLIQGHPDASRAHFCHALADAYAAGASAAGHEIRRVDVARLEFPLLRSEDEYEHSPLPESLREPQADIAWAEHLVLFFPLWLGDMPALLKGFLEQVARPEFTFGGAQENPFTHKKLAGRSARVVVTMGMPALVYRWYFRAHSVRSLERNILGFVGIAPINETLIGMVGNLSDSAAKKWLRKLEKLGRTAE